MYRKTFAEKPQYPRLRDRSPDAGNNPYGPQPPKTAENRAENLGFSEKGCLLWLAP